MTDGNDDKPRRSGWDQDLFELKDGGHDDALNKDIKEVVLVSDTFIVYIATDLSIQWRTTDAHEWVENSGDILNRVAVLETRSRFIKDTSALAAVRRQIAEGLVRCLDDQNVSGANVILNEAEGEIAARNKELAWSWYFQLAYKATLACAVAIGLLWLAREHVRPAIGSIGFEILLGTLCGAIGALLSATMRGDRLHLDANAGASIHRLEGLSRVGAGLAGAALVALAIKSGALLGGLHFQGNQFSLLLFFCIVAGASERLVPALIEKYQKIEKIDSRAPDQKTPPPAAHGTGRRRKP